jgi:hypothetical protein
MRRKLIRRGWSISAPRMIVRSHVSWPLRWAMGALALGFCAALALSAFQIGRDLAGLHPGAHADVERLQSELADLRAERARLRSVADTADSLLKAEKVAQDRLAQQLKRIEADNLALKADLGFFERLLPAGAGAGVSIRSLQAEAREPGHTRFQLLVMQPGRSPPEFRGRYEVTLSGTLDGKPWSYTPAAGIKPLQMKQYLRVDGLVEHPPEAIVQAVQVRVLDTGGGVKASQSARV